MKLKWKKYDHGTIDDALSESFCLYVFHHPKDDDLPYYIGKARFFGTNQPSGYKGSARYNGGYVHLLAGILRSGFNLYIAKIGEKDFVNVEGYEQGLISLWNPIRPQRRKAKIRLPVETIKPWGGS